MKNKENGIKGRKSDKERYVRVHPLQPQKKSTSASRFLETKMKNKNLLRIFNKNHRIYEIDQKKKIKEPGKWRTILKFLRYAEKKDKICLFVSIVFAISMGFIGPFIIYLLQTPVLTIFIRSETVGNPYNVNMTEAILNITEIGYGFYISAGFTIILGITEIIASEIASRNIMTRIKTAYLTKMLSVEIGWYDKSHEQFANTVSHDLQKMMVLFDSRIINVAEMISSACFGFLVSILVSWKVAVLTFGTMIISMAMIYPILKSSKNKEKSQRQYIGECTKIISEVLGNISTVAACGGEYKEIERYNRMVKMANKIGLKHTTMISAGKGLNQLLHCICCMAAYYFSVRLFLLDDFEPAYVGVIVSAQLSPLLHCSYLISTISDLNMATDSAYRVMSFLDSETSYSKSTEQGIVPEKFKAEVSFRNVHFSYPTNLNTKVLHDLTLDIELGKVTAVVGTSGAGKSTLVSLVSRLYDSTAGQILIGGLDIKKLNVSWLRNQIGTVTQEPTLFDASIEENIRYGKTTATLEEIVEAAKISYAHGFIEKLPSGYDTIVGERGIKLSGGQKQRIAIARAIVKKPKLLILDEATSSLDFHSEGIVQEALDNAMRGRTTLIIAHRMSTVKNADVIYAIKEGHLIEKGTHTELMDLKGYYYSLAKTQELEEKEKVVLNQKSVPKEDDTLIEDTMPFFEEISEVRKVYRFCASLFTHTDHFTGLGNFNSGEPKTCMSFENRKTKFFMIAILSLTIYFICMQVPQNCEKNWMSLSNFKIIGVWLLAILFTITTSTYLPIFFYILSLFFQSFTYAKDELRQIALLDVGYLFGLGAINFISVALSGVMSTIATQLWLEKLQRKSFSKIVSMDISWFDRSGNSPNECLEVLTNSLPLIKSVTGDRAAQVFIFILSVLLSIVYSFLININTTLANLPVFIAFFIINYFRVRSKDGDARSASLITRSTKVASEYVQSVKTIQILDCQKYVINQYRNMLVRSKKEAFVSLVWYAVGYASSKALIRVTMGTLFIFGAHVVANGDVRGTSLISILFTLTSVTILSGPSMILMSQYPAARQVIKRLKRIINTKTFLNTLTDQGLKPEIIGNVVFQDVTFSYPTREKVQVLKKLNLKIEAGKTTALVGDSGCGKSTIISLLERFYLPNEGNILVDGNDINDINVRYLRSQMGLVSQEPVLFDMTIKENILYGLEEEVTMDKIIEAAKIANVHNFILKLPQAYDTSVGERGSKLSGGQKQRIAIARAVLRNPKILLLDEATSALDTENEKAVQDALENASIGRTTIVIAHRLSTIRKADKIVVLQSGEVIEEGNHQQLMEKRGLYFNLLNR